MTQADTRLRLYSHRLSGHGHRVELFLSLLGLPVERIEVDVLQGEQKTPAFLARNPFGQIPVLEDGAVTLADSNAILVYLAGRYDPAGRWLPREPEAAARVQQWLSVAAGPLAAGPGAARLVKLFGLPLDLGTAQAQAAALFAVMETELAARPFVAGRAPTLADLALYSYSALAPEGGVSLAPYPAIRAWLARIEALPGFLPAPHSAAAA